MLRTSLRPAFAAAALTAMLLTGAHAFAATTDFTADLKGSTEVPPNDSKGTGTVTASLDTTSKKFTYSVTYQDLTGPATAAATSRAATNLLGSQGGSSGSTSRPESSAT